MDLRWTRGLSLVIGMVRSISEAAANLRSLVGALLKRHRGDVEGIRSELLVVQAMIFKFSGGLKPLHIWPGFFAASDSHLLHPSAHILHKLVPALLIDHAFCCAPTHKVAFGSQQQDFTRCLGKNPDRNAVQEDRLVKWQPHEVVEAIHMTFTCGQEHFACGQCFELDIATHRLRSDLEDNPRTLHGHLRHSTLDILRKGPPTTLLGSRHLHYTICSWESWAFLSFLNCGWLPHCRVLAPPSLPCDGSRNLDKTRNPAPTKCPPAILARGQVKATKHQATILPGAITCSLFHHIRNLSSKRIANLVNTESH